MSTQDKKIGSTASLNKQFHSSKSGADNTQEAEDAIIEEKEDEILELEHPSYPELQKKLTAAEEKAAEAWDRVLHMQADMDNAKRRAQRDIENAHKYALEKFVEGLLPVIDSLERAVSAHPELLKTEEEREEEDSSSNGLGVLDGVQLTLKMFYNVLKKFGVEQIDPQNQPFDPHQHQAVSTQPNNKVKSGTVLSVLQKGYLLNQRLVRPALVIVSKNENEFVEKS